MASAAAPAPSRSPAASESHAAPARSDRWLFGPIPDLVLGCGLGYSLLFALQTFHGEAMRAVFPIGFAPLATLVTGLPHYGATILRAYERAEDRRAYTVFTVHATLVLIALFGASLWSPLLGSLLITLYLTWSPWHYAGQNYGLAVMFLRRRGVALDDTTKRFLYASFFLSFALTFLAVHTADYRGGSYAPEASRPADGVALGMPYRFLALGIPGPITNVLLAVFFGAYLVTVLVAGARLLQRGRVRDLAPTALLVATQSLWFSVPVAA
jgi:hypothetical protein